MTEKNVSAPAAGAASEGNQLKRALKLRDLVFYGVVMMTLIAPMAVFGQVEHASGGMTPLVYLVGSIAMLFTALSYRQMSMEFPMGGSVYTYVQHGINHHVGFIAGWMILLDYIFVPSLLYNMVSYIAQGTFGIPFWIWILVFIAVDVVINVGGITYTAKADLVLFFVELVAVCIFIVGAIIFITKPGGVEFTLKPIYQPGKLNLQFIASACTIAALSFLGFDGISTLAEESLNPAKDVGKATIIALFTVSIFFIVQTYLACCVLPDWQNTDPSTGFYDAAAKAVGKWFEFFMVIVTLLAAGIANTLVAQSSAARLLFTMGRDRVIPGFFGKVHPKHKTPYAAIYSLAVFSLVIALVVPTDTLVRLVNFGAIFSFAMLNISVIVYFFGKKKQRDLHGIINYLILPGIGLCILLYIFTGFDKICYIIGITWLIIGIIIGFVKSHGYKEVPESFKHMEM